MFNRLKPHQDHNLDYVVLLIILAAVTISVRFFALTHQALMLTVVSLSIGYVVWGVTHHKKAGHLDRKIIYEYLGLAVLVNVIIFSLLS